MASRNDHNDFFVYSYLTFVEAILPNETLHGT